MHSNTHKIHTEIHKHNSLDLDCAQQLQLAAIYVKPVHCSTLYCYKFVSVNVL